MSGKQESGPKMPKGYADIADLPEDDRIRIIAEHVARTGQTVAVCVDDEPEKIERYTRKLAAHGVAILATGRGPVRRVVTIKVGPQ